MDDTGMDDVHASSMMKIFMQALQVTRFKRTGITVPLMNAEVNMEHYVGVFDKNKESTASSPSGIHYEHYTTACESEILAKVNLIFYDNPIHGWDSFNEIGTETSLYDSES